MTDRGRERRSERRKRPKYESGCSFCGKPRREVEQLIAGPGVAICDECITVCNEIIAESKAPQ
jgi:hypothetical protein